MIEIAPHNHDQICCHLVIFYYSFNEPPCDLWHHASLRDARKVSFEFYVTPTVSNLQTSNKLDLVWIFMIGFCLISAILYTLQLVYYLWTCYPHACSIRKYFHTCVGNSRLWLAEARVIVRGVKLNTSYPSPALSLVSVNINIHQPNTCWGIDSFLFLCLIVTFELIADGWGRVVQVEYLT